jgi:hypothetical protein
LVRNPVRLKSVLTVAGIDECSNCGGCLLVASSPVFSSASGWAAGQRPVRGSACCAEQAGSLKTVALGTIGPISIAAARRPSRRKSKVLEPPFLTFSPGGWWYSSC